MNILIILITAILANAVPIIRDLPHEPNIPPLGDSNLSEDVLHRTSNPSEIHERFYRASDPNLDAHVSNLKVVARITNGIYLIQGITSGTIDSDELISELLRFGSVKPSDISAIDMSKVQSAIDDMNTLPGQLTATKEMKKVEKVFEGLKAIIAAVDGIGNLTEWTHEKEHFKQEINRLAENGLNMSDIDLLRPALTTWKAVYTKLTKKSPAASTDDAENLKKSLENIKELIPKILKPGSIWQFINFTSVADGMSPILKADRGVDAFLNYSRSLDMNDVAGKAYTEYMESMKEKLSNLMGRMDNVNIVSKLLASRREVKRQLHHTFGLPNGVLDLSRISSNIFDPWIAKVVKTKRLEVGLGHLKGLAAISKEVDESIGNDAKGIQRLLDIAELISDISNNIDSAKSGIAQGYNCTRPYANDIDKTSFTALNETFQDIDAKLLQLKGKKDELSEYVESGVLRRCDEVIAICKKMEADGSNSPTIVKELEGYESLGDLSAQLTQMEFWIDAISVLKPIISDAKTAYSSMDFLKAYHDEISTQYSGYFKCLQDQDQLKVVFQAIDGLNRIRGWKDDTAYSKTLTDGLTVVKTVVDAKSGLEKMKESIKELSELKTPETDALKDLPEAATHSKVIGKAVQGLAGMAEALKQEDDIKKVVNNIDVVETGKQKSTNSEDVASLNELVKLSKDITPMLNSLTTFSTSLSKFSKSDSLAVQSDIFSSAKQVSGVTGVFSSMVKAVGELKKISSPPDAAQLTKVEEGLKTMDTLDLDFAGFHESFDGSKKSLTALDLFFAKTWKKFQPTTPIPAQRPTLGLETSTGDVVASDAQSAAEKDEETKEENDDLKYAGGSVALFLITMAIVFFLLYKFQRPWLMKVLPCLCWKKEKKKEKEEDEKPSEPPLPPEPFLFGPILPPVGYFFKLFIVPIFKQFEVMKTEEYWDKIDVDSMLYEYLEIRHNLARLKAWDEEAFTPEWGNSMFANPRHNKNMVMLKDYGTRFKNIYLHGNYLMLDDNREPEKKDKSGNENKSAKKEKSDKRFEDAGEAEGAKYILIERPFPRHRAGNVEDMLIHYRNSTIPKFWWLVKQNKTQSIVALIVPNEIQEGFYDYPVEVNKTITDGDMTLKCDSLKIEFGGLLEIRTITGTFGKEPPHTVNHYHYTAWVKGTYPVNLGPLKKIFRLLATDSTPPIIHCSDGQERTGMFAMAGLMKHRIKMSMNELDIKQCMIDVMSTRVNALQNHQDVAYSVHLCMELLADNEVLPANLHINYDKMNGAWDRYLAEKDKRDVQKSESLIEVKEKIEVVHDDDASTEAETEEEKNKKSKKYYKKKKPKTPEEKKRALAKKMKDNSDKKYNAKMNRKILLEQAKKNKLKEAEEAKERKETKK